VDTPALRVLKRFASSYFSIGTEVLYGKWKNHRGRVVGFGADQYGNPTIEIEPIPKGRKKNKVLGLYRIWRADVKEKAIAERARAEAAIRVASRYLTSKRNLGSLMDAGAASLRKGNVEAAIKALDDFWTFLEVGEVEAEIGYAIVLEAEWFYALGPQIQNKVRKIIREAKDLRRSLPKYLTEGPVPHGLINRFEALAREASWLDGKVNAEGSEFPHGDFTIIPMPGVSGPKMKDCLEALDKAAEAIRPKFSQLLYGKVYINRTVSGGVASYVAGQDTIQLGLRASKTVGDVRSLCHEFGHRYAHKFWKDKGQRDAFWALSVNPVYDTIVFDKVTRAKLADEFLAIAEAQAQGKKVIQSDLLTRYLKYLIHKNGPKLRDLSQEFLKDPSETNRKALRDGMALSSEADITIRTDKIIREPIAVTPYAKKGWLENFAEAFSLYMLGESLPPEVTEIMKELR